jgi:hypothetical protein
MERDTTIPSSLAPMDAGTRRKRRTGVHPIFLIMLALVLLLLVISLVRR